MATNYDDALKKAINGLNAEAKKLEPWTEMSAQLKEIQGTIAAETKSLEKAKETLEDIQQSLSAVGEPVEKLARQEEISREEYLKRIQETVSASLADLSKKIDDSIQTTDKCSKQIEETLQDNKSQIADDFFDLGKQLESLQEKTSKENRALSELVDQVKANQEELIKRIGENGNAIEAASSSIGASLNTLLDKVGKGLSLVKIAIGLGAVSTILGIINLLL